MATRGPVLACKSHTMQAFRFKTHISQALSAVFLALLAGPIAAYGHGGDHGPEIELPVRTYKTASGRKVRRAERPAFSLKAGLAFATKLAEQPPAKAQATDPESVPQNAHGTEPSHHEPTKSPATDTGYAHDDTGTAPHYHSPGHDESPAPSGGGSAATDDGHNHDHSSKHGFGARATKLMAQAGYRFLPKLSANATIAGSTEDGIDDPLTGLAYVERLHPDWFGQIAFQGSFPASKESRELERVTTLTPSASLINKNRR